MIGFNCSELFINRVIRSQDIDPSAYNTLQLMCTAKTKRVHMYLLEIKRSNDSATCNRTFLEAKRNFGMRVEFHALQIDEPTKYRLYFIRIQEQKQYICRNLRSTWRVLQDSCGSGDPAWPRRPCVLYVFTYLFFYNDDKPRKCYLCLRSWPGGVWIGNCCTSKRRPFLLDLSIANGVDVY